MFWSYFIWRDYYPLPTTHYPLPTTHYPLPNNQELGGRSSEGGSRREDLGGRSSEGEARREDLGGRISVCLLLLGAYPFWECCGSFGLLSPGFVGIPTLLFSVLRSRTLVFMILVDESLLLFIIGLCGLRGCSFLSRSTAPRSRVQSSRAPASRFRSPRSRAPRSRAPRSRASKSRAVLLG